MIDGLVVHGDEAKVAQGLRDILAFGAAEVLVSPILAGADRAASLDRTSRVLGQMSRSAAG